MLQGTVVMSLYNESNGHKEKNSGSFLEKLGKLFWNIPGERHKILHPALILYILILVWYSYLLLGPYNSRISPSDFLNYIKLAGTDDPSTFGRIFCERLSVLLPLRLLIVVFKFSPAVAGKIVILAVELLLLNIHTSDNRYSIRSFRRFVPGCCVIIIF